jgi:hypothetical protein
VSDGDTNVAFVIGTLPDGRVLVQFCMTTNGAVVMRNGVIEGRMVDHLKLTPDQARAMASGLDEAARDAKNGRVIQLPGEF